MVECDGDPVTEPNLVPKYIQPPLPRNLWWTLKSSHGIEEAGGYRVMKSKRELPGTHLDSRGRLTACGPSPRVKIKEPGVYRRVCKGCGQVYWYALEQTQAWGVLRFKWIDQAEAEMMLTAEKEGCYEQDAHGHQGVPG